MSEVIKDLDYEQARRVIKILSKHGLVKKEVGLQKSLDIWNAAFEIIEEVKSDE